MRSIFIRAALPAVLVLGPGNEVSAQTTAFTVTPESLAAAERTTGAATAARQPAAATDDDGNWDFSVYPILAWVPLNLEIEVTGPFDVNGGGGGGGNGGAGGGVGGTVVDGRFDGAFLAGFSATNGAWRIDVDGVYAAVGGDRQTPNLSVDLDAIYGQASIGRELAGGVFVTGGVRRFALEYEIDFLDFPRYRAKPGIWDPLVGVAYHKAGRVFEFHAHTEYGGFGVGADHDFGLGARIDFKPFAHVGLTAGYNLVTFRFTKDVGPAEFKAKQTIGGPVAGIGVYF